MKLGCDIVHIPRLEQTIKRSGQSFLGQVFHNSECHDASIQHLAGIFAAKEAAIKAFGLLPGQWLKLCVQYQANGCPQLHFLDQNKTFPVSISHDGDYALAVVCITQNL